MSWKPNQNLQERLKQQMFKKKSPPKKPPKKTRNYYYFFFRVFFRFWFPFCFSINPKLLVCFFSMDILLHLGFERVQKIGQGSFGSVYKCWNPVKEHFTAIKFVDSETAVREIGFLYELRHCPGIVQIFSTGPVVSGGMAIEMELQETDLERYHHRPPPIFLRRHLMTQILQALQECHRRGIVHADLKPSNILVGFDNNVRLADFGLSQFVVGNSGRTTSRLQTAWYRAPEIFECDHNRTDDWTIFSKAIDVWSVGCIWLFLVKGRHWFEGCNNKASILEKMRSDLSSPSFLDELGGGLGGGLGVELLDEGLEQDEISALSLCLTGISVLRPNVTDLLSCSWFTPQYPCFAL